MNNLLSLGIEVIIDNLVVNEIFELGEINSGVTASDWKNTDH